MFNVMDKIKINEELCQENKRTEKKFQFGTLNYLAIMLEWEFEVEKVFIDEHYGDMVECKVTNVPTIRSNVVLRSADILLMSKTMLRMDFEILGKVNKYQPDIDKLRISELELLSTRNDKKINGMLITNRSLIDNWNEIKKIRVKIKSLEESKDKVFKVKHVIGIFNIDCKEEDIPSKLRTLIRTTRKTNRVNTITTKTIGGGMTYDKIGGVMVKPAKFLELNEKFALNIIKEHKVPTTKDHYVGIEIEMLAPKTIENMNKEFIKARLHRYVNVGTDVSIRVETDGFHAMELRVCLPENLLESKLKEICDVLRRNDCYSNRSCGMHVHLDMRARNPELCYRNLFKVQNIMLEAQPISRRTNKYCAPNKIESLKLKDFDGVDGNASRRQVINTQSYNKNNMKTIEIRVHEGETKYKDIINWVKFLIATASLGTEIPAVVKGITGLRALGYLDESIVKHLSDRIEQYSA